MSDVSNACQRAPRPVRPESLGEVHGDRPRSKVGATTTAQLVWILAERLPGPDGTVPADEWRSARGGPESRG